MIPAIPRGSAPSRRNDFDATSRYVLPCRGLVPLRETHGRVNSFGKCALLRRGRLEDRLQVPIEPLRNGIHLIVAHGRAAPKMESGAEGFQLRRARSLSPYRSKVKIPSSMRGTSASSFARTSSKSLSERMVTCSMEMLRAEAAAVAIVMILLAQDTLDPAGETQKRAVPSQGASSSSPIGSPPRDSPAGRLMPGRPTLLANTVWLASVRG